MLKRDSTLYSKIKFSDECKISLLPHGIVFVRKRDEEDWKDPRFRYQREIGREKSIIIWVLID
jgi:hypothetical protein